MLMINTVDKYSPSHLPSLLCLGTALLAGSTRYIKYFPNMSMEGCIFQSGLGSAFVFLTNQKEESESLLVL